MPTKRSYRDTASFGRRQEYIAASELLRRGFDVYMTLVDDQGIDCIVRFDDSHYVDIQIKARSKTAKQWNFFAAMKFTPRKNLWFVFFTEKDGHYWIIPSKDVKVLGTTNKNGKHKGKVSLSLPKSESGAKAQKYSKYRDEAGFNLLKSATS